MLFIFIFIITFLSYSKPFVEAQSGCRVAGVCEYEEECGILSVSTTPRESHYAPLRPTTPVSGGRPVYREEMPWQAGIYSRRTEPYMQVCGGSVVSTRVVISAAHCFWSDIQKQLPAADFSVAAGKLYRPWNDKMDFDAQKSEISTIRIPPRYHGSTTNFQDDLAVIILANPFKITAAVQPICLDFDYALDQKHLIHGNLGKVAGWGRTDENGKPSPTLQVVNLPSVDVQRCYDSIDPIFRPAITSDKICAGNNTGGTAVCMGDSGGGLVFPENSTDGSRFFLRGVVSTAPKNINNNLCNIYTYATFTHLIKHEHFIREVIAESAGISSQSAQASSSTETLTTLPERTFSDIVTDRIPYPDPDVDAEYTVKIIENLPENSSQSVPKPKPLFKDPESSRPQSDPDADADYTVKIIEELPESKPQVKPKLKPLSKYSETNRPQPDPDADADYTVKIIEELPESKPQVKPKPKPLFEKTETSRPQPDPDADADYTVKVIEELPKNNSHSVPKPKPLLKNPETSIPQSDPDANSDYTVKIIEDSTTMRPYLSTASQPYLSNETKIGNQSNQSDPKHTQTVKSQPQYSQNKLPPGVNQQSVSSGNQLPLSGGNQQSASSGNQLPLSGGNQQSASSGNQLPLSGRNQQSASSGNQLPLSGGNQQSASSGNQLPLSGGNQQSASSGNQLPPSGGNQQSASSGNPLPSSGESQETVSSGNQLPLSTGNNLPIFIGQHSQSAGTQPSVHFMKSYPYTYNTQANTGVTMVNHKWQSNPGLFQYYRYPQQEYHGNYHHDNHHQGFHHHRYHQRPAYPYHGAWHHLPHNQW